MAKHLMRVAETSSWWTPRAVLLSEAQNYSNDQLQARSQVGQSTSLQFLMERESDAHSPGTAAVPFVLTAACADCRSLRTRESRPVT